METPSLEWHRTAQRPLFLRRWGLQWRWRQWPIDRWRLQWWRWSATSKAAKFHNLERIRDPPTPRWRHKRTITHPLCFVPRFIPYPSPLQLEHEQGPQWVPRRPELRRTQGRRPPQDSIVATANRKKKIEMNMLESNRVALCNRVWTRQ